MPKRTKTTSQRKLLDRAARVQVIIAVLGTITAVAGCVEHLAR